jgi:hypothetical protein
MLHASPYRLTSIPVATRQSSNFTFDSFFFSSYMSIFTLVSRSIGSPRHANAYFGYGSCGHGLSCFFFPTLAGLSVYFWCLGVVFRKIEVISFYVWIHFCQL